MAYHRLALLLFMIVTASYSQRDKKFFRKDYKFIEASQSFYKIHTIHKNWADAKKVCELEGATLLYPEDKTEADAVIDYWTKTQPFSWVFIGVSDLVIKGVFETIDGQLISEVYDNWGPGEPNNANGVESCATLRRDGTLNDVDCGIKYPFICKKTYASLEWNSFCNMPNIDYKYAVQLGQCYKFHNYPKTWQEAYVTCSAEQSYLAIINSQAEADYLTKLTEQAPKDNIPVQNISDAVHLGFHKRDAVWTTIKGTELKDSGYSKWGYQQPDNAGGDETCGSMFYNGQLNDINCSQKSFFICEHAGDSRKNLSDGSFRIYSSTP